MADVTKLGETGIKTYNHCVCSPLNLSASRCNLNASECMKKAKVDCTLCYTSVQHKQMRLAKCCINISDSQCECIPDIYVSGNMGKCKLTDAHTHMQCLRTKARDTSCAGAGITCTQRQTQRTRIQMCFNGFLGASPNCA
jgi:hypothetical protein